MGVEFERAFNPVVLLVRRWLFVAITMTLGLGIGIVYSLLAPKWYRAQLSMVPTTQSSDPMSAIASMKDLPEQLAISAGISSESERIAAVLLSNSVLDEVIKKFDLVNLYDEESLE